MTGEAADIIRLDDVGSTNDEAMARLRAGADPFWLTAQRQLAGRGRRGRHWVSEPGNLYSSYAFRPEFSPEGMGILPLAVAVALSDALQTLGLKPQHKWPNDVLIGGRKCAGILIETEMAARKRLAVIGIGVNITHHPDDAPSTHLCEHLPQIDAQTVFDVLRPALAVRLALLADDGPPKIRNEWLSRAVGLGGPVTVRYDSDSISGRFLGLDPLGRLILSQEGGDTRLIAAGDVFVRTEPL
ncbi:MAG: biotin--[acetyl-CoA-carboxylase] ligase [Pseudomonadota bacterium]